MGNGLPSMHVPKDKPTYFSCRLRVDQSNVSLRTRRMTQCLVSRVMDGQFTSPVHGPASLRFGECLPGVAKLSRSRGRAAFDRPSHLTAREFFIRHWMGAESRVSRLKAAQHRTLLVGCICTRPA